MPSPLIFVFLALLAAPARAAELSEPAETALAACAEMQERFAGTECIAVAVSSGNYRLTVKAATPDAMRVVFMRSLDVADGLCSAGNRVELAQELVTTAGARKVNWTIAPPECGIKREG